MTLRQREPREKCEAYLTHIRSMPCLICAAINTEAAHLRTGKLGIKSPTGGAEKPSDKWALPLCNAHHREQHDAGSEVTFWNFYKLDPFAIAMRLWTAWKTATGYVASAKRRKEKSHSSAERTPKPRPATARAVSKPARPLRAKSAWPKRHGTMKSRNSFDRQERT